ncbi:MAG: class I SAM-dependent methyltransferase, partial [Cyanobacteria bacterium]|nr:class I SAM-dependent methyltransferase [Cyanobacteriota bacterium]
EEALRQARGKAEKAGVTINFIQADLTKPIELGEPFPFVFDRGTYHICRQIDLPAFRTLISKVVARDGLYIVLAGNANERSLGEEGPPKVRAHDLCRELEGNDFDLLSLRETQFHGVKVENRTIEPLAWAAILKHRGVGPVRD